MTEKKDLHKEVQNDLTAEEQSQLIEEERYFHQYFACVPCPELPKSLRADAIWEKICAGGGDHQVTVDPNTLQPTQTESQPEAKQSEKVIPFPKKAAKPARKIGLYRRGWAIACTLVLVVGLSLAYWKINRSMGTAQDLVARSSDTAAAESASPREAAELTEEAAGAQTQESAPQEEQMQVEQAPMMASAPESQSAAPQEADQAATATEQTADAPSAYSAQTQDAPQVDQAADSQREELRQRILESLGTAQGQSSQEKSDEENPDTGGSATTTAEQPSVEESAVVAAEQPAVEQAASEQSGEEASSGDSKENNLLKNVLESAKENHQQTFELKNGSVVYNPESGTVSLLGLNGDTVQTLSVPEGARVFASGDTMAQVVPDEQGQSVTMTLYNLEDLQNPQAVNTVVHQGELFDAYQSVSDSYTLVTSVWFDRQQVENGEFLPQVNGEELSPEQVNVVEGYGQDGKVNYLITTTLTPDSVKTRADLYLN